MSEISIDKAKMIVAKDIVDHTTIGGTPALIQVINDNQALSNEIAVAVIVKSVVMDCLDCLEVARLVMRDLSNRGAEFSHVAVDDMLSSMIEE